MWDLIVSVPDHCLSFYFDRVHPLCTDCFETKRNGTEGPNRTQIPK